MGTTIIYLLFLTIVAAGGIALFILILETIIDTGKNNDDEIASKIRELSKKKFDKEAIRDLIEEKYSIILSNDFLDKYI